MVQDRITFGKHSQQFLLFQNKLFCKSTVCLYDSGQIIDDVSQFDRFGSLRCVPGVLAVDGETGGSVAILRLGHIGQVIDKFGNLIAEFTADILESYRCILDNIM